MSDLTAQERADLTNLLYARGDAAITALDTTIETVRDVLGALEQARQILGKFDEMLEIKPKDNRKHLIEALKGLRPDLADKSDEEIVKMFGDSQWKPNSAPSKS